MSVLAGAPRHVEKPDFDQLVRGGPAVPAREAEGSR